MTELCIHFGISRVTGYRILDNYKIHGEEAFSGISKSHKTHPFTTPPEIVEEI